MDRGALRTYVDRSRELVDASPELSEPNTQLRLVQPFFTALGWELHRIDADRVVDIGDAKRRVDFALLVEGEPAVLVETVACATDLQREHAQRLGRTVLDSGVDRGVLTNGRAFVFVADDGGALDRTECRLQELPERADAVAEYSREAVEQRVRTAQRRRRDAARSLAEDRESVVDDIRDRLVETAGDGIDQRLRDESEAFVDRVIEELGDGDTAIESADGAADASRDGETAGVQAREDGEDAAEASGENTTATATDADLGAVDTADLEAVADADVEAADGDDAETAADLDAETAADVDAEATAAADPNQSATDDVPADALGGAVAEDGQYVIKFFNGRTSVWAVGHARAVLATAQAIEYLLKQGAADRQGKSGALSAPWGPEGERAVVVTEAVENATLELSNGWHLDARVTTGVARTAVEQLAERAGLRVMFTGWD
ncbi:hypothetical protein SAMN06269185_0018 [Natronoarchaeum philippinense]|uniref:Type I restriction enzyme R protein N-terminal domain-containing protein n=1 Tax=Natronoarchaeum philippinense TaxID=558529 RepID=A0A285MZ05_NATPI|nr:hypothetical protein [Natronoarchaeum philippinense]SNZ02422.1 hypothetical protein SAMN06269185_0018 [Natronoarchaeum philippinense]